ncbi:MAG: hypothetical protein IT342_18765 [Candidatus Melainabacteria bacterium]|nr:hypothetical protein [Candidatus Melainabacteria bacterium]
MKPAERLNSKSTAAFFAIFSAALAPLFIAACLLAMPAPAAGPQQAQAKAASTSKAISPPVKTNSPAVRSTSPAVKPSVAAAGLAEVATSSRVLKVWQVTQTTNWGKSVVKACAEGIRIEANTGSILVAKAPDWEVVIFRPGQKMASKNSFAKFITKYPHNTRCELFCGIRRNVRIAGAQAVQYVMPINRRLDSSGGFGSTFRSKLETQYVSNMILSVASDSIVLPPKAKEIWRTYFEFSFIEKVPLEYYFELGDGSKRYQFQTVAQNYARVPASEFEHPQGLEYSGEFMQMIFGKKVEDVADILTSP